MKRNRRHKHGGQKTTNISGEHKPVSQDDAVELTAYLEVYARSPHTFLWVPKGLSEATNFMQRITVGVLPRGKLVHCVDDNLESLTIEHHGLLNGTTVTPKHFKALLDAGEKATARANALSWGIRCYKYRESNVGANGENFKNALQHFGKNTNTLLRFSTWPRLIWGGFFAMAPASSEDPPRFWAAWHGGRTYHVGPVSWGRRGVWGEGFRGGR